MRAYPSHLYIHTHIHTYDNFFKKKKEKNTTICFFLQKDKRFFLLLNIKAQQVSFTLPVVEVFTSKVNISKHMTFSPRRVNQSTRLAWFYNFLSFEGGGDCKLRAGYHSVLVKI